MGSAIRPSVRRAVCEIFATEVRAATKLTNDALSKERNKSVYINTCFMIHSFRDTFLFVYIIYDILHAILLIPHVIFVVSSAVVISLVVAMISSVANRPTIRKAQVSQTLYLMLFSFGVSVQKATRHSLRYWINSIVQRPLMDHYMHLGLIHFGVALYS